MTDYVEAFRANLPAGITFDATLNRYFCNDKRYLNEWEVEAYLNYIKKFGFTAAPPVLFIPSGSDSLITSDGNTFKVRGA